MRIEYVNREKTLIELNNVIFLRSHNGVIHEMAVPSKV